MTGTEDNLIILFFLQMEADFGFMIIKYVYLLNAIFRDLRRLRAYVLGV